MAQDLKWLADLTFKDFLKDGRAMRESDWADLDWSKAWLDMGPSVAGNPGPYWHVPHRNGDTTHRLYPRILKTKWLRLIRRAIEEGITRERMKLLSIQ